MLPKLDILDSEIEQSILANKYNNAFASDSRYVCPYIKESNESAWAQYTLLVDDRDSFQLKLKERNISTAVHYPMPLTNNLRCLTLMLLMVINYQKE